MASFLIALLIIIGIFSILAVSLNLALGYTGLLNLGHVALFGIGAYTSAILTTSFFSEIITGPLSLPFLVGFIVAGLVSSLFGFILIWATRRLKGDYFALATLGFAFVIFSLLKNIEPLTRGPTGIANIPSPVLFGFDVGRDVQFLVLVIIVSVLSIGMMRMVANSSFGKLMQATRDDELGLRVLGKNSTAVKYKVMALSGFFAGISGSLFAHFVSFINPDSFFIGEIVLVLIIVIIGGVASIPGSILGAAIVWIITEGVSFLPAPFGLDQATWAAILGPVQRIVFGLALIVIMVFRPRGILGRVDIG